MRIDFKKCGAFLSAVLLASALAVPMVLAEEHPATFTGTVSDAMCGAKHGMGGSPADCTRACVKQGSKYALVVGDKVYTLEAKDKAALDTLDKLAGAQAQVKGTAKGDTIQVGSVSAPGK